MRWCWTRLCNDYRESECLIINQELIIKSDNLNYYFKLQGKRFIRHLKDFGINPIIGVGLIALVFIVVSFAIFKYAPYAPLLYVLVGLSILNSMSSFTRIEMLKAAFDEFNYFKIRLLEHIGIVFPFFVFLLIQKELLSSALLLVLSALLAFIDKKKSVKLEIATPFRNSPFEFPVGFRKYYGLYFMMYSITGVAIYVGNFNLGVFAMLAIILTSLSFYSITEPEYYVWTFNYGPQKFLKAKIKTGVLNGLKSISLITITLIVAFPSNFWIVLAFAFIGQLYLVVNILLKYAFYPNNVEIYQAVLFPLLIFFPPLLLLVIPYYYQKSLENLNHITA